MFNAAADRRTLFSCRLCSDSIDHPGQSRDRLGDLCPADCDLQVIIVNQYKVIYVKHLNSELTSISPVPIVSLASISAAVKSNYIRKQ